MANSDDHNSAPADEFKDADEQSLTSVDNSPKNTNDIPPKNIGKIAPSFWNEFFIATVIYGFSIVFIFVLLFLISYLSGVLVSWMGGITDFSKISEATGEVKMKEYEIHISLFQYYLTLGFSAVTFFYAITGGILAYILKNGRENTETITFRFPLRKRKRKVLRLKLSLLLPILLSNVFGGIFIYGAYKWLFVNASIIALRSDLGIRKVPDLEILLQMLFLFGVIFFFVGFILLIFFFLESLSDADEEVPSGDKIV